MRNTENDECKNEDTARKGNGMLLIIIQLIVSVVIIAAALAIKLIGGTVHAAVGTWFYENYNNTILITDDEPILPFHDDVRIEEESTAVPEKNKEEAENKNTSGSE